jgi:hypothetical protein
VEVKRRGVMQDAMARRQKGAGKGLEVEREPRHGPKGNVRI